ncbi:hypothetical protein JCM10908_005444 [Rhodotorula pacifica]|uniref:uncharacterized protein n=1 Tax=Rhodotorula pacifica TaxID=1495444 RepID=UPI003181ED26
MPRPPLARLRSTLTIRIAVFPPSIAASPACSQRPQIAARRYIATMPAQSPPHPAQGPRTTAKQEAHSGAKPPQKRIQKPVLVGEWQPNLPSRMGARSKGCGHYVWGSPVMSGRIAAFDLDGTVIQPTDGKAFPKNSFDWQFCSPLVVPKLRELHRAGYSIVLISNQASSNPKLASDFRQKIPYICRKIGVPLHVYACWDFDEYRKPAPGMWRAFEQLVIATGQEIDYTTSFYVGDAAGRRTDHADTDRKFALNAGLRFMTPEELFSDEAPDPDWALWGWNPFAYSHTPADGAPAVAGPRAGMLDASSEVVLLVGAPASGKTHHWEHVIRPQGYQLVKYESERGYTVPLDVEVKLHEVLGTPTAEEITTSSAGIRPAPLSSLPSARLVLSSSFPSRHSRRALLAYIRTTHPHVRVRAIVFSPVGGFDEARYGKGGVELWKHTSVWRMAYGEEESAQGTDEGNDGRGGTRMVPIEAFKKWERDWEEPTLEEGFDTIEHSYFALDPTRTSPHAFAAWHQWLADVYPGKAIKSGRIAVEGPGWTGMRAEGVGGEMSSRSGRVGEKCDLFRLSGATSASVITSGARAWQSA